MIFFLWLGGALALIVIGLGQMIWGLLRMLFWIYMAIFHFAGIALIWIADMLEKRHTPRVHSSVRTPDDPMESP